MVSGTFFTCFNDFELEIIKSEYNRARLMILVLLVIFSASIINSFFLDTSLIAFLGGVEGYYIIIGWVAVLTLFEIVVLVRIRWFHTRGLKLPYPFKIAYTFLEISLPGALMFYMITVKGHVVFLDSPLFTFYFLIICLSTLHLNFSLSFSPAFLASVQYAGLVYYCFYLKDGKDVFFQLPSISYYARCVMLLITGMIAGFVAEEIKKRVHSYLALQKSKLQMELTFGQQVSAEIVQALTEQGETARQLEATIMVLDIRNFSAFAEQHSPDEILDFQNRIFGPILNIIKHHNGIVNQILGDGIMATFGAPVSHANHARDALQAATEIREKVKALFQERVIPETHIGIGLHTGPIITGNIGNETRKQYSISGTAVIVAFRVEQLNKELGSELLITEERKQKINDDGKTLTYIGPTLLKGLGSPTAIYKVN